MNKNGTSMGQGQMGQHDDSRIDAIKEKARGLVDRGEQKVDQIRSRVVDVKDQAMSRGNDIVAKTSQFITSNPLKSVGLAFAVGFFGLRLFRR